MFSADSALEPQQSALAAVVPSRYHRGEVALRLDYQVDLGAAVNGQALAWRFLPGRSTKDWFIANHGLRTMTQIDTGGAAWTFGASHNNEGLLARPGKVTWRGFEDEDLFVLPTGVCVGLLGGWVTSASGVVLYRQLTTFVANFQPLPDYVEVARPFEYNGHLFFSAFIRNQETNLALIPVIGYIEPHLFSEDVLFDDPNFDDGSSSSMLNKKDDRWNVEHFSIEHIGYGAQVGLYQGQLVVATSQGVWQVRPLDGGGYGLGTQVLNWGLTETARFAICNDLIAVLDQADLLVVTPQSQTLYPQTRFTALSGNGHVVVLSNAFEVAISNGAGWMTYLNKTAVGTLVRTNNIPGLIEFPTPSPQPVSIPQTVQISTLTVDFDCPMAIRELLLDEKVIRARVLTDRVERLLRKSVWNPMQWRCGFTCQSFLLELTVPVNERIQPPTIFLKPRSRT